MIDIMNFMNKFIINSAFVYYLGRANHDNKKPNKTKKLERTIKNLKRTLIGIDK